MLSGLLAADIHMVTTHPNQSMIAKRGDDSWNMETLLSNYDRLQYHLGVPNGKYIDCPVFTQNKKHLYTKLLELDLCLPTILSAFETVLFP